MHDARMLIEEVMENGSKNTYHSNKISFKDNKVAPTSNVKPMNDVDGVESYRPDHSYRVFTTLQMKATKALKGLDIQGHLKPTRLMPNIGKGKRNEKYDVSAYWNDQKGHYH